MTSCIKHKGSDAEYAKHDPATSLASLFRPVAPGRRPKGLDVTIKHGKEKHGKESLRFVCFEWLDMRDQSVLLAAISLARITQHAGEEGGWLSAESKGERGKKLWEDLKPKDMALLDRAIAFSTTRYALLKAAGMSDSSDNYVRLKEILFRLSSVNCGVETGGNFWSMHMMSFFLCSDGKIDIALNGRFARAIVGHHHVRISLKERHSLKSDMARLIHAQVCARLRAGNSWPYNVDNFAANLWGETTAVAATLRGRRSKVAKGFQELLKLPYWRGKISGQGEKMKITVVRPKTATLSVV